LDEVGCFEVEVGCFFEFAVFFVAGGGAGVASDFNFVVRGVSCFGVVGESVGVVAELVVGVGG